MMLKNKNAIFYGAGGSIGGAMAMAMAEAGANVFVTGRHLDKVERLAEQIRAKGYKAEAAQVDALDEAAVNKYVADVVRKAGSVDISFNLIGLDPVQNVPLVTMSVSEFVKPVELAMKSQFITSTAACKVMMKQQSGVILTLTATPGGIGYPLTGGFSVACNAMECFMTNLASEVGVHGIRAVNIRSGGSPDSQVFKDAQESAPEIMKGVLGTMKSDTMLKELPAMKDVANVAVFLASPMAGKITGVTVDVTAGTTAALNYRSDKIGTERNSSAIAQ